MKCISNRINGDGVPLNGSCRLHGHSNENINGDVKEVCSTTYIRIMMRNNIQEKRRSSFCKSGHLCPEIYKALDVILFIAEHKKSQEESNKVIFLSKNKVAV